MTVPPAVETLITEAPVSAHVATAVDDRPHVAPVWYGYREGVLYFMTGGRKLANVRRNPRIAVSIESADRGDVEWNVTLLGRARVVDDPDRIDWASGWIYDRYDGDSSDGDDLTDDRAEPDGGTEAGADDDGPDYALVEVDIGSTASNVYE